MVNTELMEVTNSLHRWRGSLRRWYVWNRIIETRGEEERWSLRIEFVDVIAFFCLFQPSAVRDQFTLVATNAVHQVLLATRPGYEDMLEGEQVKPEDKVRPMTRRNKEDRLGKLVRDWPESHSFITALRLLNDESYTKFTADYRNRASHAIAPHFGFGDTQIVTRRRKQLTELVQQQDGTYVKLPVAGKMCTSYTMGGTEALNLEATWSRNRQQFSLAFRCFNAYVEMLEAMIRGMPRRRSVTSR
jgi:hypothetical protein